MASAQLGFPLVRDDQVFIDTSAWVAIQNDRDEYHRPATDTWSRLLMLGTSTPTSSLVVGESYTFLRRRIGYAAAWRFIDWLGHVRRLAVHRIHEEHERAAYAILRQYRDQDFSYVDATSFAFMRSAGISEAFAFDAHFATAGFTRIPLDRPLS